MKLLRMSRKIYSEVLAFSTLVFNPLLDLLEEYTKADLAGVKLAAAEMIRILESIDTDDDMFPEYEIGLIRDAVSLCEFSGV